eukprot:COSAG01_NODE_40991_length_457_cov_0.692737_1_plen_106_part_10
MCFLLRTALSLRDSFRVCDLVRQGATAGIHPLWYQEKLLARTKNPPCGKQQCVSEFGPRFSDKDSATNLSAKATGHLVHGKTMSCQRHWGLSPSTRFPPAPKLSSP